MPAEITVILKDEEKTCRYRSLVYEKICVDADDPCLKICVNKALENFQSDPDDIIIQIKMVCK